VSAEYPRTQAPVAPPGRYTARLAAAGRQYERSFEIRRDSRLTATDDDLRAQFALMVQIRDRVSAVTDAVDRLRKARQQLNERQRAGAPASALADARDKLQAIESALTRLPGPSPHILPPKALNNRLAGLSGDVQQADGRPTRQMAAVFEELSGLVGEQLRRLEDVLNSVRALTNASGQH
jgi:methyl-accepting chemotaxis protein